jgi:hypothetical protein
MLRITKMQYSIGKSLRWLVSAGLGLWVGFEFGSMSVIGQQDSELGVVQNVIFQEDFSQGQGRSSSGRLQGVVGSGAPARTAWSSASALQPAGLTAPTPRMRMPLLMQPSF